MSTPKKAVVPAPKSPLTHVELAIKALQAQRLGKLPER